MKLQKACCLLLIEKTSKNGTEIEKALGTRSDYYDILKLLCFRKRVSSMISHTVVKYQL